MWASGILASNAEVAAPMWTVLSYLQTVLSFGDRKQGINKCWPYSSITTAREY